MDSGPWLVVGLGNPGPSYAGNRHNVGFMVAGELATRTGGRFAAHRRGRAEVCEARLGADRVVLAKPRSYMNESGGPVKALADYYKVGIDRIAVVHDDLDIPFGAVRLKTGGGDGGHNGLRSLRSALGGGDFHRVRVGIGRPPGRMDPADFVLRDFTAVERRELPLLVDRAADAAEALLQQGLEVAQNLFHAPRG